MRRTIHDQRGFILPILLFNVVFIVTMIAIVGSLSLTTYNLASRETYRINAQFAADAGLDAGLHKMNTDPSWTGTSSADPGWTGVGAEIELMNDVTLRTTYESTLSPGSSDDRKILAVTARAYAPASSTTPKITRKYEVDVQAVTSGTGPSSVVTGVGGLNLLSNAKISGGDVVVNGTIDMENNSQIGLSTNPVNVRVAHKSCPTPPDATYPQLCGPGNGEPITMGGTARIYGEVWANNQLDGTNMFAPGLQPDPVDEIVLPPYARQAQIDAVTTSYLPTDSTIACSNNQTKTWPANIHITGNVTTGNGCTITLNGNVWVDGNVTLGNNARFVVAPSSTLEVTLPAAQPPTMMVDGGNVMGTGGFVFGNNSQIIPNSSGTGVQIVSFWSAASCSPNCTDVTGTDLANSQNVTTINLDNNGSASNSILWSHWSKARIANNGAIGAVTGQTVELGNNAVINFTASIPGSDNLTVTWAKRGYMRVFD